MAAHGRNGYRMHLIPSRATWSPEPGDLLRKPSGVAFVPECLGVIERETSGYTFFAGQIVSIQHSTHLPVLKIVQDDEAHFWNRWALSLRRKLGMLDVMMKNSSY